MVGGRSRALIFTGIIAAATILLCPALSSQGSTELEFILSCNPMQDASRTPQANAHDDSSHTPGIRSLFTGAIRFYQRFISTQDAPTCNFVPTCSQFGVESIRRLGAIRGILLTSDRLQRCNSMSNSRYQMHYKSGRLIDPVEIYAEILR